MKLSRILILFGILLGVFLSFISCIILFGLPSQPDEGYYSIANFDYVIPRPGDSQVNELKAQSFIDEVIPYYNYSSTILDQSVNIYLIDGKSDYTPFGDTCLLEGSDDLTTTSIIVDNSVASILGVELGDVITLDIEGVPISFSIIGIARSNGFSKRPSMAILFDGMQKSIICSKFYRLAYSGAFVCVNNRSQAESYFTYSYIPKGKIGNISWYENEELYRYTQESISSSPAIFEIIDVNGLKAEEQSTIKAYESNVNHFAFISNLITSAICIITWLLFFLILRPSFTKSFMMGQSYKKTARISSISELLSLVIPLIIFNVILSKYGFIEVFIFNTIPVISYFILLILSRLILIPKPQKADIDKAIRNSQLSKKMATEQYVEEDSLQMQDESEEDKKSDNTSTDYKQNTVLDRDYNNSEN